MIPSSQYHSHPDCRHKKEGKALETPESRAKVDRFEERKHEDKNRDKEIERERDDKESREYGK